MLAEIPSKLSLSPTKITVVHKYYHTHNCIWTVKHLPLPLPLKSWLANTLTKFCQKTFVWVLCHNFLWNSLEFCPLHIGYKIGKHFVSLPTAFLKEPYYHSIIPNTDKSLNIITFWSIARQATNKVHWKMKSTDIPTTAYKQKLRRLGIVCKA